MYIKTQILLYHKNSIFDIIKCRKSESDEVSRITEIELTNMCLVNNDDAVLVQKKDGTKYKGGLIFPGGHVEGGEYLRDLKIREIKEETGLIISYLQPCGCKNRIQEDGTIYIVLMYKTNKYKGEIKSSEE